MAHFAKIGKGNIVEEVIVISNDDAPNEKAGQDFIKETYNDNSLWLQTSYNTKAGVHLLGGTPFRMNYAQIGGTYDPTRDAFIPLKLFPSYVFDEETCTWDPPVELPADHETVMYAWDETILNWRKYGS